MNWSRSHGTSDYVYYMCIMCVCVSVCVSVCVETCVWYMIYDMVWYDMIWYDMMWYNMILCTVPQVQEIPAEDLKKSECHACPALHLHSSKDVTFLKPVIISIPATLGGTQTRQFPPCRIKVFFRGSGGGIWEDVTERLDGPPKLKNGIVQFQVRHFSS